MSRTCRVVPTADIDYHVKMPAPKDFRREATARRLSVSKIEEVLAYVIAYSEIGIAKEGRKEFFANFKEDATKFRGWLEVYKKVECINIAKIWDRAESLYLDRCSLATGEFLISGTVPQPVDEEICELVRYCKEHGGEYDV